MQTTRSNIILGCIIFSSIHIGLCQERIAPKGIIEAKRLIQQGCNHASADEFDQAATILAPVASQGDHQALAEYFLGYIDYNLGVVVYRSEKEKAASFLDSAVMHLERAIQKDDNSAEAHALLSSCTGIQISFSPLSGIWRGPKAGSEMAKAKKLSPENPRVALLDAIGTYNTPALFGGGKEKGFEAMKKAADLFDRWKTADSLEPDWGKEQVYAWIGLAYLDRNETILARKAFEKSLEINPEYGWVKYVLMKKVTPDTSAQ
jgi:tetratricopeptide (TPR) repeat protein